ncbi:caspase, EACC1-associated type [Actinokineospora cianjurensis]|uniref:Caspase domain-containing protein n=1 Tax=Actinokineospora cianjurensis TaxID=585224 RepID=A0A421AXG6_9PSEU|nr:caspase family protein [Actinokineospora cianjurensis]RLK54481.1 caspase domain-containing protein [Actinokineospora cianjurensis]
MRLPDPARSRAILVGTSTYQATSLPDLPAVPANLHDLKSALTAPGLGGFAPQRCTVVENPGSTREVYRALREQTQAEDTVLVYFAGHGLVSPGRGELHFALADTDPDEVRVSALAFDLVRDLLRESPAANRVLVLDCCFSGRALGETMGAAVVGQVEVTGTYTLVATPPNAVALAPKGHRHTAFTGELLAVLRDGLPDGPDLLGLDDIARTVRSRMAARGYPTPGSVGSHNAGLLAIARNPVHVVTAAADDRPPAQPVRRRWRYPSVWVGVVVVVAAASAVLLAIRFVPNDDVGTTPSTSATTSTTSPATTVATSGFPAPPGPTIRSELPGGPPSLSSSSPRGSIRVYDKSTVVDPGKAAVDYLRGDGWTVLEARGLTENGLASTKKTTVYYSAGIADQQNSACVLATTIRVACDSHLPTYGEEDPGVILVVADDFRVPG